MYSTGVLLADRYRLDDQIGRGGMGEVWRGTDQVLGRTVAVKVMRPALVAQPGFAQRFLAEARAMATIKHPSVVAIYDYQGDSSGAFLVMELVEGEPLSQRLQRLGRLDPVSTMKLVAQTADALQAAHDKGIVHRDVKPANLLVTDDDRVVLTDFGIARSGSSAQLTATGDVIGTPSYLAPEQVLGRQATRQSDIYALGVVAYECLTGRPPFTGDSAFAIASQRLHQPPAPMDVDAPDAVVALVQRALAKEPEQRWISAGELADAAREAESGRTLAPTVSIDDVPTRLQAPSAAPPAPPPPGAADPTRATVPAHPAPTVRQARPTPVQPVRAAPPAPAPTRALDKPAKPARPAKPPRPTRPRSLILAGVLLLLVAACLAIYALILRSVSADLVDVADDRIEGNFEMVADALPIAAWAVVAAYGVLAAVFLLLAGLVTLGSRAARGWTFTLGYLTLLIAAPVGVVGAYLLRGLEPRNDVQRELVAAVPSSYLDYMIIAGITAVFTILVTLVLLTSRPAKRFIADRGR